MGMPTERLTRDGREDARAVKRCRQGDVDAFSELVLKYQDGVFNVVYRIVGDREEARDIAQEAFVRAFEGIGTFNEKMPFRAWIYRIGTNAAIDHLRRAGRGREVPMDEVFDAASGREPSAPTAAVPENASVSNETSALVHRALLELPDNYRAAVVLHHLEGLGYREVGEVLGVPRNTAKTWAYRARGTLCRSLEGVI